MLQSLARSLRPRTLRPRSNPALNFLGPSLISKRRSRPVEAQRLTRTKSSRFVSVSPLYTPTSTGETDNIFITRSYDATSHFETVVDEVQDVWRRVTGRDLELKAREDPQVEE